MDNFFEKTTGSKIGCAYKWGWSTIRLKQGKTSSCHRTSNDPITSETFDNFHNTPIKIETRQKMLANKWPDQGCQYCEQIENAGGISDRNDANQDFVGKRVPPELLANPTATHISPTMVEVYFSNLCNMSCIYCSDEYSTVWEHENRKFNEPFKRTEVLFNDTEYAKIVDKFFTWLDLNIGSLAELNVLGGEPFIMPEFDMMVDFFESHPNPDLKVSVFSNLKVPKEKFADKLRQLESFVTRGMLKQVEIVASLDCWAEQQEYIRTGLSLTQWEENFSYMIRNHKKIKTHVHSTITGLTIHTIPELIEKINYYNTFREDNSQERIGHSKNFVVYPRCLSPKIFPAGFFDKEFDQIFSVIKQDKHLKVMQGYKKTIDLGEYNPALIKELKAYLDKLDSRRNTNWKLLFPWLDQFEC